MGVFSPVLDAAIDRFGVSTRADKPGLGENCSAPSSPRESETSTTRPPASSIPASPPTRIGQPAPHSTREPVTNMSPSLLALLSRSRPDRRRRAHHAARARAAPSTSASRSAGSLSWARCLAAAAAFFQLQHADRFGTFTAFYGTVQIDAFSVFFHLLIAAVAVVTLLSSLDYFEGPVSHAGEYFALVLFGATSA